MSKKTNPIDRIKRAAPRQVEVASDPRAGLRAFGDGSHSLFVVDATELGVDLAAWLTRNEGEFQGLFVQHRAILFRGFDVAESRFAGIARTGAAGLIAYTEPSTPRTMIEEGIYTSTEYPSDQVIPLHNEHAYTRQWPERIWFFCDRRAASGGQTPIADGHQVYEAIPEPIRRRFIDSGVLYVRNYGDEMGLRWEDVFRTSDRATVEAYCRDQAIDFEWKSDGSLRTLTPALATITHPMTGRPVWFNQAHLFHVSNLPEQVGEYLTRAHDVMDLPRHAMYGDGTAIEEEALGAIRHAYDEAAIVFDWQAGDVLVLDNLSFAHGRRPYTGDRRVLVAMTGATSAARLETVSERSTAGTSARRKTASHFLSLQDEDPPATLRYKLAGLFRILAMEGMDEGISGHISLRVPGSADRFWVNPFGRTFDEVTPDNLLVVDYDGNVVEGDDPVNVAAFCTHAAIHQSRPDVTCAVHIHSPWGVAFSVLERKLDPLDQNCCMFFERQARLAYNGPVNDSEEADRVQEAARNADLLIMEHHGAITLGETLEAAGVRMVAAERAFRLHLRVLKGGELKSIDAVIARSTREWIANPIGLRIEFEAYLRRAERRFPDLAASKPS